MAVDDGGPGQRYLPVQRPGGFRDLRSGSECWGYCLKVHISVICFTVALQFLFIHLPGIHWILAMCWTQSLLSGKCGMRQSLCKVGTLSWSAADKGCGGKELSGGACGRGGQLSEGT